MRITLVTLFVLFLSSCSIPFLKQDAEILSYEEYKNALPTKITNAFKLKGKLSLFVNKEGQTGKILWDFKGNKDTIHILNPFNTKIAEIVLFELEKKVILKFSKNKKDSEKLISKIFGKKENIFLLKEFIINPPKQLANKNNITIRYQDWDIHYQGNKAIKDRILPNIIQFEKANISLKIFISDWIL